MSLQQDKKQQLMKDYMVENLKRANLNKLTQKTYTGCK